MIKHFLPKQWNENVIVWHLPYFQSASVGFTKSQVVATILRTFFCAWYAPQKHWLANNILGIAFCIQGIEMLSLGSFKIGAIILLLFPTSNPERPFSMIGLGVF
ncbi:Peptidase A22B signal peptide peptidase protein [Dioscorea alata]|uniref:Peptidase A22B signal peptide peptidase protein n=1 Tax=Dioscorea alata TaxID=55571 RepID=A0ACB7V580_DIOAL|nr:Peptidase A22B signal peptide peptidase protein [Dioscorea alata]